MTSEALAEPSVEEIEAAAGKWRPLLASQLGRADVADAAAELLSTLWELRERFDPARGSLEQFAYGVAWNVIRRRREANASVAVANPPAPSNLVSAGDPAESVYRRERLLLRVIASSLDPLGWAVVQARAYEPATNAALAVRQGVKPRRIRAASDEVSIVSDTAYRALDAALAGASNDEASWSECVTELWRLREVAQLLNTATPGKDVAERLGVAGKTARNLLSAARRMVAVAELAFTLVEGDRDA